MHVIWNSHFNMSGLLYNVQCFFIQYMFFYMRFYSITGTFTVSETIEK